MTRYPIFTKTLVVVVPSVSLVPLAGLAIGAIVALILITVVVT